MNLIDANEVICDGVTYVAVDKTSCRDCDIVYGTPYCNRLCCTELSRKDCRNVVWKRKFTEIQSLVLNKPKFEAGSIKITIKDQSHIGSEFGNIVDDGMSSFIATNGMELCSEGSPMYWDDTLIFVRGTKHEYDNEPIIFNSIKTYHDFLKAVREYNEFKNN